MAASSGPDIATSGLILALDAPSNKAYSGFGDTWSDRSGNGNNGTLLNGVTYDFDSFLFDGTNDRVSTNLKPSGARSYFIWVKFSSLTHPSGYQLTGTQEGNSYTYIGIENGGGVYYYAGANTGGNIGNPVAINTWVNLGFVLFPDGSRRIYKDGVDIHFNTGGLGGTATAEFSVGCINQNHFITGNISQVLLYNRALSAQEVLTNYNSTKTRNLLGSLNNPLSSPTQAQIQGYPAGVYYFRSGGMSSPALLEFQPNYYEGRSFCCVFRSPYRSTATTNRLGLSIPMGGLLVQRDALDLRAAVYWSTPIIYNSVCCAGNNTADSGYSPRRVILGFGGGHGIFATNQQQCNWGTATGAIGAGWDGSTCGSFPNDLVWGTGRSDTATYENRSGTWSHWITWS